MSNSKTHDQFNKALWAVVESIRDAVGIDLVNASQTGVIDIKGPQLERLILILNGSIDAGFQRSSKNFLNEIDKAIVSSTHNDIVTRVKSETKKKLV